MKNRFENRRYDQAVPFYILETAGCMRTAPGVFTTGSRCTGCTLPCPGSEGYMYCPWPPAGHIIVSHTKIMGRAIQ